MIQVLVDGEPCRLTGREAVEQLAKPLVDEFETYFRARAKETPLASYEKEILMAFAYFMLIEKR